MTFPIPSYSAFGEDRLILKLVGARTDGFYVDIGCHHPIDYSNTYALYRRGWRGLAVDADPEAIAAFAHHRPEDKAIHCALGSRPGAVTLHLFNDRSMNTMDEASFRAFLAKPKKRHIGDLTVECRRLDDLLAQEMPPGRAIDFLNVDCEGADLDILESNDWRRFRPGLIAVEDLGLDLARLEESGIYRLLRSQGYRLDSQLRLTSIYRPA